MNELLIATQKTSAVQVDPYYNLVSLHLKGDVNTGRDYNAFSDASSNNFRLTNSGDVRGTSFSPYNTSWSAYFDGTGDFVTTSSSAALALSTGDFTAECWVYPVSIPNWGGIYSSDPTTGNAGLAFGFRNTGDGQLQVKLGNDASQDAFYSTSNVRLQTWSHLAVVRSGSGTNNVTLYINGVAAGSMTSNRDVTHTIAVLGRWYTTSDNYYFNGHLSNFRLIKGQALFTGNFTPTTSTLTSSSVGHTGTGVAASLTGTVSLLTCQSNRFIDSTTPNAAKSGGLTLTPSGETRISSFSSFLDSDTTSGSGYFDGSGDYLSAASNAAFTLGSSSDFCIEGWVYSTGTPGTDAVIAGTWQNGSSAFANRWLLSLRTSGTAIYWWDSTGSPGITYTGITTNQWVHIAVVRNSGTITLYVNGVSRGTQTTNQAYTTQDSLKVGGGITGTSDFPGYISSLRVVLGSPVYTTAFTPPTAPLAATQSAGTNIQAITGTQTALLTLQERGAYNTIGFQDESEYQHVITRPSGANVAQGTFSPFSNSGWSNSFNGSTDCLSVASHADFNFGSGNFTAECWVNWNTASGNADQVIFAFGSSGQTEAGFRLVSNNTIVLDVDESVRVSYSFVPTAGTWYHFAVVRDAANTYKIYQDGVLKATGTYTYTQAQIGLFIGGINWANNYGVNGFISNFRAVKGIAVYTGAFTPPTAPLTATQSAGTNISAITGSATSILTLQSNRFVDNSVSPKTLTVGGSPRVTPFSPFAPFAYDAAVHGGSAYFDGSGDYLNLASSDAFNISSGDFTIETWVYRSSTQASTYPRILTIGNANYSALILWTSGNTITVDVSTNGASWTNWTFGGATITNDTWTHLALVRNAGTISLYKDGVSQGTPVSNSSFQLATPAIYVGTLFSPASNYWTGYIGSTRIVKGTAVYTSNFTPPSGPLPLLDNTSLLLNFTNAGIIDSTGKNIIETVGNAGVVTTSIKKYGSGSMYFDGTADYLVGRSTDLLSFNTGDFTVEMWVYPTSVAGAIVLIDTRASGTDSGWAFYINSSSRLALFTSNADRITAASALSASTWTHIVLARSGSTLAVYMNGVQSATATYSTTMTCPGRISIASGFDNLAPLNGYIDDLRITKGFARYTTNFTAPTKAHPDSGVLSTLTTSMVAPSTVDYLVVGGGGGGGRENFSSGLGGGGGAGGFITGATTVSAATNYVITVGGGGPGLTAAGTSNDGFPSSIVGGTSPSAFTIPGVVAAGGGGGGGGTSPGIAGRAGGSGGGGGTPSPSNGGAASPAGQGNAGGSYSATSPNSGGGGGGAGEAGNTDGQGEGGDGTASSISGSLVTYAGGGGGSASFLTKSGGLGGGGDGGNAPSGPSAQPGGTNTGGGGGGGFNSTPGGTSGAGGSGIVIIAYPSTFKPLKASLGLVYTIDTVTRAGYRVYKFTAGTGTISW